MKILLVRPFSSMGDRVGAHSLQHPIGLCLLAAVAREAGARVGFVDCEVEPMSPAAFSRAVADEKPDLIGFTAMTPVIEQAARMAAVAKKTLPSVKTIVGGAHASAMPVETLKEFGAFDVAATGEGELKLLRFAEQIDGGNWGASLPGCAMKKDDEIIDFTAIDAPQVDLDALPLPARDLLKLELYGGATTPGFPQAAKKATVIFTTRGCASNCIFCASAAVFGRRLRYRPIQAVVEEVRRCKADFGFAHFTIDDDAFTFDRSRVTEFCRSAAPLGITWDCDARVGHVDEEMLAEMARSGCRKVAYGVESGSSEILKKIKKGITIEQIRAAFAATKKAGILSCAFILVGQHPDETREDVEMTRKLISEIVPDLISVAVATPFPGTELRGLMERENLLATAPWRAYNQAFTGRPFTRTKSLSPDDLFKLRGELLRGFFLRAGYIVKRLSRLRSLPELAYWMRAGAQFVAYLFESAGAAKTESEWEKIG